MLFWLWVANGTSHRIQLISPLTLCQGSYISWRDSSGTEFQSSCQLHLLSFGANSYSPFSFFLPVIINFPGHLYAQGSGLAQAVLFACRLNICCGSSCSLLVPNGSCNSQNSEKCIWQCQGQELTRLLALQSQYNGEETNQHLFFCVDHSHLYLLTCWV